MSSNQDNHEKTSLKTDLPVLFTALSGEEICARLTKINFVHDGEDSSCEISFEVSSKVYEEIMQLEAFHLLQSLSEGQYSFNGDSPIEIRAVLRTSLANHLAEQGKDAESIMLALLQDKSSDKAQPPLNQTECWLALELKQKVDTPAELEDSGSLKAGFQTRWKSIEGKSKELQAPIGMSEHVASFLQQNELNYEAVSEQLLKLRFTTDNGSWISLIRLEEKFGMCVVYSVFPNRASDPLHQAIAVMLMNANYDLLNGSFEMDEEDGEIRLRSALVLGGRTDSDVLASCLAEHIEIMEHYLPAVEQLLQQTN